MAHPRRIVAAETYLITRRCYQRTFRLRPSPQTNRIFMYCLGLAMLKTGVVLHAACVMSNHHHLVVTDPLGVLPIFLRELHRLTAKTINASQGEWESLWAPEPCNAVRLVTDDDIADKIAYVAANPVAAGLVAQPGDWPGFVAWEEKTFRIARPEAYFREDGDCPAELVFAVDVPRARDDERMTRCGWTERIAVAVASKVEEAHKAIRSAGRQFMGRKAVLATSFIRRARSYEEKHRTIPTFAARLWSVRDRLRRIELNFRGRYRAALERWRSGWRDVAFPFGTWGMLVTHSAVVEPAVAT